MARQAPTVFDPIGPSTADGGAELLAWLRKMRDENPVWRADNDTYHIFRYADVQQVLSDPASFSSDTALLVPEIDRLSRGLLPRMDPPRHRALRRLANQAFTSKTVTALEPRIARAAHALLDEAPLPEFDLIETLAYPLPVVVVAELLGLDPADRARFRDWANRLIVAQVGDKAGVEVAVMTERANRELKNHLRGFLVERRVSPGTDLLSRLAGATVDGTRLTDDEVANMAVLLLSAGHVTTTSLLGHLFVCFADDPGLAARLRAERGLIPAALEEVLRLRSPIIYVRRVTRRDVTVGGHTIPANRMVTVWLLAANHDERKFPEPERVVLNRTGGGQAAFGHGIHFCLGAPLARVETRIALNALFDRFEDLRVTPGAHIPFYDKSDIYGMRVLPLTARRAR
ncbi:cytochrome P450 [Streptomyces sp. GMR22]|uniref:cytochrome P450 n=1 Tax=Streptomyces sp. GMR22 TaxID=2759524 RepID=UPI0015FB0639|nr:cytochrome P450 [Streptomyces sp. GMR22]MBA6439098.1 cytochrome P450 [Streptomyces sp. GMR22]